MLAGKAPGARRLKQDSPQELDDIPLVMLEDVVGGCLQIRERDAHPCLQDDVSSEDVLDDDVEGSLHR